MALDANNKLQNEAHDPQKVLGNRSYVDAAAMQALIDKIAGLKKSLADNEAANLEALKKELQGTITALETALAANKTADDEQATEQAEIKSQVETNTEAIEDIKTALDDKVGAEAILDWVLTETYTKFIDEDYAPFKTAVNEKLDEILAAIQVVVSADDVAAAYDAATADEAEDNA